MPAFIKQILYNFDIRYSPVTSLPTEPAIPQWDPRQFQGHPRVPDPYNGASYAGFWNYVHWSRTYARRTESIVLRVNLIKLTLRACKYFGIFRYEVVILKTRQICYHKAISRQMGCEVVIMGKWFLMFRRIVVLLSSGQLILKTKTIQSFEILGISFPMTERHVPEYLDVYEYGYENFKCRNC
jgi:hypothetical protein